MKPKMIQMEEIVEVKNNLMIRKLAILANGIPVYIDKDYAVEITQVPEREIEEKFPIYKERQRLKRRIC